jgi:adenylosuccinate lyase
MSHDAHDTYISPFVARWCSQEMVANWSDNKKFRTWRRLWVALAESQKELGLDISEEQIAELRAHVGEINYEVAKEKEKEIRHDVMAHVYAYGEQCPSARGIIHLGATSCYVGDNTDLIQIRDALDLLMPGLATACRNLAEFARSYRDLPCLGYTHFQQAQVTTVGKRATLWLQELQQALQDLARIRGEIPFRSVKGTTGTQASYLSLFDGDHDKVKELERRVAQKMGFEAVLPVSGQTYPRSLDYRVLGVLGQLACAAGKMGTDIRLLAGLKEMEEPFGKKQVGSSAMAYKRNPMRSERMCSLSRFLLNDVQNAGFTAATQWLERTLDDSANRRLSLPEGFLAADAIVQLASNVTAGLVVNEPVVERRLRAELPFMATETILMAAVRAGGDRQELHEAIREHSMAAAERVKQGDGTNDLIERIEQDDRFAMIHDRLEELLEPAQFVGRAPQQVEQFLADVVEPALAEFPEADESARLRV